MKFGFLTWILPRTLKSKLFRMDVVQQQEEPLMRCSRILSPPNKVLGMTEWNPNLFVKKVQVPRVLLSAPLIGGKAGQILRPFTLKIPFMNPVKQVEEGIKGVLLNPDLIGDLTHEQKEFLVDHYKAQFDSHELELTHKNYLTKDLLRAVLPANTSGLTSFNRIGHIVHVNLKDDLWPYKKVIGQILLETVATAKLVVMKTTNIDNTFRNLELEVLAGNPDGETGYVVTTKETGCRFELDFSKVYWNPRLSTEHERVTKMLQRGDILYDVFAGVGPFAIPIAVKGTPTKKNPVAIDVFANDLNPDSVHYLERNVELNKIKREYFKSFNLDGKDFIENHVKQGLLDYLLTEQQDKKLYVVMNLPTMATQFLSAFVGLLKEHETKLLERRNVKHLPIVHVYAFSRADNQEEELRKEVQSRLECCEPVPNLTVNFVRNVAPYKDMFRITFPLSIELLTRNLHEMEAKRRKLDANVTCS